VSLRFILFQLIEPGVGPKFFEPSTSVTPGIPDSRKREGFCRESGGAEFRYTATKFVPSLQFALRHLLICEKDYWMENPTNLCPFQWHEADRAVLTELFESY